MPAVRNRRSDDDATPTPEAFAALRGEVVTLRDEVRRLREENDLLRNTNQVLADRNTTIERLSSDLMQLNIDLSQISRIDPMTRLLNRAAFEACMTQEHDRAVATGQTYAVIMADVDHFKSFNDTRGHQAGDEALIQVAEAIRHTVRKTDFVGRYGGEEIIVLCPTIDGDMAAELAERIREAVQGLEIAHPHSTTAEHVTISLGVAVGPMGSWPEVVRHADERLYVAKHHGRNQTAA